MDEDNVGTKIFVTEGVVPSLWDQLKMRKKQDKTVEGYLVGALRNLCGDSDGFWASTLEDGGVEIILRLLQSSNPVSQSNSASLLARLIRIFTCSISKIVESGAVHVLVQLLGEESSAFVRASVVNALEAITSKSEEAKNVVRDLDGVHLLIGAVLASSKELVDEENERVLQSYGAQALANLFGGMSALIVYLGGLSLSVRLTEPVADILGALAYALRNFELICGDDKEMFDPSVTEGLLVKLLKPRDTQLIQERVLEAMASLYGNNALSNSIYNVEAKRVLVGLTILAMAGPREWMITCLSNLCKHGNVWDAIGKREGIQIIIPFLGLSSERHQELSVEFLAILTDKVNESRWAVTSAGGIPPLLQILETSESHRAKEDAVCVLWNLCCHSEEIRVCVEKAGAIPALLGLLKSGTPRSQEISSKTLVKLIRTADPSVIEQVQALFLGDAPKLKTHVIRVLGHVLASASLDEFVTKGSAANNGLRSLVQRLASSNEKMKENAASILVDLFNSRNDLCGGLGFDEDENPCTKLLSGNTHAVATQLAHALGSLSNPTKKKTGQKKISGPDVEVIKPLIKSAKTNPVESAENPMSTLANLLSDPNIAAEALNDDVVSALTRLLREGTLQGKRNASHALHQLLKHFQVSDVFKGKDQCRFAVPELIDILNATDLNNSAYIDVLEVLSLLAKAKYGANLSHNPFSAFTEVPSSLDSLVRCVAEGHPLVQDKAIEILSRFCKTHFAFLGELFVTRPKSICSLANRTINSSSSEIKVGGAMLLMCAAKNDKILWAESVGQSGYLKSLISTLLDMSTHNSICSAYRVEIQRPRSIISRNLGIKMDDSLMVDSVTILGSTVSMWLLSVFCSTHPKIRFAVMEASGLEIIVEKLQRYMSNTQENFSDSEEKWIAISFLAVMSQEPNVVSSPATANLVPTLALLMQSDQMIDGYFTAQVLAGLVHNKNDDIIAEIMDSDIVETLINSVGYTESDTWSLGALAEELSLLQKPFEATLEALFEDERVRRGLFTKKCIPFLVNLLKPNAQRPGAFPVAVLLLSRIAEWGVSSKILIAEAGALDALAKYLSLSPQDSTEFTVSELLGSLFRSPEITQHETAISSMKQLIGVLDRACRSTRYSAARALREPFSCVHIRDSEFAWKALSPLIEMLDTTSESERDAALTALVKLTTGKSTMPDILTSLAGNPLENIYKILSSDSSSLESKTSAARICCFIFNSEDLRTSSFAIDCMVPLISLIHSGTRTAVEAGIVAVDRLLDSKKFSEVAEEHDCVNLFFGFVASENHLISEAAMSCLVKTAKDKTPRKMELIKMGIIEQCLGQLSKSPPNSVCCVIAELFRVLTNVGVVARSQEAIKMVQPLLLILLRQDLDFQGKLGGLQAIANILEKPMVVESLELASSAIILPLIALLESESIAVQHAAAEVLTSLLEMRRFQEEITSKDLIAPLVKLVGIKVRNLQEIALMGLEKSSVTWTKEVADAEGIREVSKVIIDEDPQLSVSLWESAAFILCNILRYKPEDYLRVTVPVLAKMLFSTAENTVTLAIKALIIREKQDSSSVVEMAEAGALDALLDLLGSHHCEEVSGGLLQVILGNPKVREIKMCQFVISPLSDYLVDGETRSERAKLVVAMALGDISKHEGLAKSSDAAGACRALISLIEKEASEEMQMVVMCALGNLVRHSRTSRKAVAEAGGVCLFQEILKSSNSRVSTQAALMIKSLFSNHTLQEYVSSEIIKSLTGAMERELWTTAAVNVHVVRTLNVILTTFPKLRSSEAATECIPHLIRALKCGEKEARESALETLYTLRQSWISMPTETAKSQAVLAAEAIPVLQMMMKSASFHERGNSLLNCLPGSLTVAVKRGDNLKRSTNAFCSLVIDNRPTKKTTVAKRSSVPVWKESFTWDFSVPPRGQLLQVVCKSNHLFRNKTLGTVRIPIDKVLTEGNYSGSFKLSDNKDGCDTTLEIDLVWSNQVS